MNEKKKLRTSVLEHLGPSEEDIIFNSKLEHLYNHEFERGRFFKVIFQDNKSVQFQLAPRTSMKVTYINEQDDIEGFEIIKIVRGTESERLKFSKFNLQQLKCFLEFISSIDLKGISERRIALADDLTDIIDEDTKRKVLTLLSGSNGADLIEEILTTGVLNNRDIVNTGYRKIQLELFSRMLSHDYLDEYKIQIGKPSTKDETAWQYFFNSNPWIFGYGLDYHFNGILQKEFSASDTDADGKNQVNGDFLIGDNRFTTFVELKLPSTKLFSSIQNRARTWKLSSDLQDAVSQLLEQKASGQIKLDGGKLYNSDGAQITQQSFDSKCLLIVGDWTEIKYDDERTAQIKTKTFELYRRNLRNIEIITYDELYERARHIVGIS